jgi:hypothetical protein
MSKGLKELLKETYSLVLPMPSSRRDEFLEVAREKVAHYKPRIEEEMDVNLGNVRVSDMKYFVRDQKNMILERISDEYYQKEGKKLPVFPSAVFSGTAFVPFLLLKPLIYAMTNLISPIAKYEKSNNSIYFPFNFSNRVLDIDYNDNEKRLDQTVVHELSHGLWHALGGEEKKKGDVNWRLWNEGFATYCEQVRFAHLYPEGYKMSDDISVFYEKGKNKIEDVVEAFGDGVLLDVPREWRGFDISLEMEGVC